MLHTAQIPFPLLAHRPHENDRAVGLDRRFLEGLQDRQDGYQTGAVVPDPGR